MMKKQYHTSYAGFRRTRIDVYHDGVKIASEIFWDDDGDAQIEHLEKQGYTLGYTRDEIEQAERELKNSKDNLIEGENQ
jgi:hypothetical protein